MLSIAIYIITAVAVITTVSGVEPSLPAGIYGVAGYARGLPRGTLLSERSMRCDGADFRQAAGPFNVDLHA